MSKPRVKAPKTAKKGDIVQIKTLINHKMETGRRKDKKTGQKIPRNIIHTFTATFNGKPFFTADLKPSISARPYLLFYMRASESGEFQFKWEDDAGKTWTAKKALAVS